MMIQNIFGKQASFERRLLFTVLGAVLAMVDVFTEPFGLALDVAWITVLFVVCLSCFSRWRRCTNNWRLAVIF